MSESEMMVVLLLLAALHCATGLWLGSVVLWP